MAKTNNKKIGKKERDTRRAIARKVFRKLTKNISTEKLDVAPVDHSSGAANQKSGELSGYIFMCSGMTKPECYVNRVFGLPAGRKEDVEKIKPGTMLFLFDFDVKLLYGVYEADSTGGMNLQPIAFGGRFPAQVKFRICMDCLPLPLNTFRTAIKDNYQRSKFAPELNDQQVRGLLSLFKPIIAPSSATLHPPPPNPATKPWVQPAVPESLVSPASNGAPGPRMPCPARNGHVNPSLNTPLQMQHPLYTAQPLHNRSQLMNGLLLVQKYGQNPHSHPDYPSTAHQAPLAHVDPHQFPENQPPYLSNEIPRNLQEPYPRHMTIPEVYPHDQTSGFNGGYDGLAQQHVYPTSSPFYGSPHLQTPPPYSGPPYVQSHLALPRGPLVMGRSVHDSSFYSFARPK